MVYHPGSSKHMWCSDMVSLLPKLMTMCSDGTLPTHHLVRLFRLFHLQEVASKYLFVWSDCPILKKHPLLYYVHFWNWALKFSALCNFTLSFVHWQLTGEKKKCRGKEGTKLLLSSRMTGYNSSSTWQTTDTRGKVKMIQGYTNAWRYFSCR